MEKKFKVKKWEKFYIGRRKIRKSNTRKGIFPCDATTD